MTNSVESLQHKHRWYVWMYGELMLIIMRVYEYCVALVRVYSNCVLIVWLCAECMSSYWSYMFNGKIMCVTLGNFPNGDGEIIVQLTGTEMLPHQKTQHAFKVLQKFFHTNHVSGSSPRQRKTAFLSLAS